MRDRRFVGPWRDGQRPPPKASADVTRRNAPDPMFVEQPRDPVHAQARPARRGRRQLPQLPHPRFVGGRAELEQLHVVAVQLLSQPIREAVVLAAKVLVDPREFANLKRDGIVDLELAIAVLIRVQRVREHERVPAIVLRAGHREPVPEAIQLLRVDRRTPRTASRAASPRRRHAGSRSPPRSPPPGCPQSRSRSSVSFIRPSPLCG